MMAKGCFLVECIAAIFAVTIDCWKQQTVCWIRYRNKREYHKSDMGTCLRLFPSLREFSLTDMEKTRQVRVGLRPFMPGGKPMIGPVPGLSNIFVAAGHDREGLTLALGTAEMVVDMVLGNPTKVDNTVYALHTHTS